MTGGTDASTNWSDSGREAPPWLSLDADETVRWQGGPRIQTIIPSVLFGLAQVVVAVVVLQDLVTLPAWLAARPFLPVVAWLVLLSGVGTVFPPYFRVRNTEYLVTDRTLYRKEGVLSRTVTAVGYETVQNVSYSQGITGRLFDYGTLSFDTAGGGGTELTFDDVDDPGTIERLVEDHLARVRRGGGEASDAAIPGTVAQWDAVLEEVRAIRRAVEGESRG